MEVPDRVTQAQLAAYLSLQRACEEEMSRLTEMLEGGAVVDDGPIVVCPRREVSTLRVGLRESQTAPSPGPDGHPGTVPLSGWTDARGTFGSDPGVPPP